jgi:hypothetical protein
MMTFRYMQFSSSCEEWACIILETGTGHKNELRIGTWFCPEDCSPLSPDCFRLVSADS